LIFVLHQKKAGKGAESIHKAALRRLRHYAELKDGEKAHLVELLCKLKNRNHNYSLYTYYMELSRASALIHSRSE